jgi:cytochrome c-type biogenesis protein
MDSSHVGMSVAFVAGLLSFLSPCMLPLVPLYLAQLVGKMAYQSTAPQGGRSARFITFAHATLFVLGFTLAFVALGATASTLGSLLRAYQSQLRVIGGILLILIGLHLSGILSIPLFWWQKRMLFQPTRPSYPASLLIGIIFAIGWTPCIGLILGPILGLAAAVATLKQGVLLLLAYSLGMGVPFLLLGLGVDQASWCLRWLKPHLRVIEVGTGVLMILVGILISLNMLTVLNRYVTPGFGL